MDYLPVNKANLLLEINSTYDCRIDILEAEKQQNSWILEGVVVAEAEGMMIAVIIAVDAIICMMK